ncbi:MAG: alpha/beta fold hydrolase [Gammaproteobacteria bacterium]
MPAIGMLLVGLLTALLIAVALLLIALAAFSRAAARRAEQTVPPVGRFVEVPGARLHLVEAGESRDGRTPIVMLHGLAAQLHNFRYALVDDLARDTRVVAFDRPGSGYSTREPGRATTLEQQADAITAALDALGIERALFVGHSLGGALSLAIAQRHPHKVTALALLAPLTALPPASSEAFRDLKVPPALRALFARVFAVPYFLYRRARLLSIVFGPERMPNDYPTRAGGVLTVRPSHFIAAAEDFAAVTPVMPRIEAGYPALNEPGAPPVHVLYGRGDRVLDHRMQGEGFVARVPGTRLELVDGGHMLPVTQAARCVEFIRRAAGFA